MGKVKKKIFFQVEKKKNLLARWQEIHFVGWIKLYLPIPKNQTCHKYTVKYVYMLNGAIHTCTKANTKSPAHTHIYKRKKTFTDEAPE